MKRKQHYSLRGLRKAAGLTIQQVSEQTGIPYSTVQALESGRGKGFDVNTKNKLAGFYKVPMVEVFAEERERAALILGGHVQLQMFTVAREDKTTPRHIETKSANK